MTEPLSVRRDGGHRHPESTTVAIVGAGPAGLTLAILLRTLGVDCVVPEQRDRFRVEQRQRAYLAGCDGYHGVIRRSIPEGALSIYSFDHGIGWLTVLNRAQSEPVFGGGEHSRRLVD